MTTTHPDAGALYRAILAHPEDDAPRLAYADWCDENGEPERGEFIRVECDLAKADWRDCGGYYCHTHDTGNTVHVDCNPERLRVRADQLLQLPSLGSHGVANWCVWSEAVRRFLGPSASGLLAGQPYAFSRGFVHLVELSTEAFFAHAAGLFAACPITAVRLTDAVIHNSGGTPTCYVGGLGRFPKEYWRRLEDHPYRSAALVALSAVCVEYGRRLAGLTPEAP